MKRSIMNTDHVIYITKEYLQSIYPTDGCQYECSDVIVEMCSSDALARRLQKNTISNKENHFYMGSIGSVSEKYKGHEIAIKALAILTKKGYDIEYFIVGGGNPNQLKELSECLGILDRVHFLGKVPHREIATLIDKWNLYIQPSLSEAQGRSLIEAMGRGCICICSDVGGMKELLPKKMRFKKGDYKELATLIEKALLLEPEEKNLITNNNIDRARAFNKDTLDEKRRRIFEQIKNKVE